ncbi:hypothetical protein [Streptomyces cacaoi]|nr:hypothetical protein [Streptomyces cacaoi]
MTDESVQSVPQQTAAGAARVFCGTVVIDGSGVMVFTVGARAICVELEN